MMMGAEEIKEHLPLICTPEAAGQRRTSAFPWHHSLASDHMPDHCNQLFHLCKGTRREHTQSGNSPQKPSRKDNVNSFT
jgi:hypothetical protein